MDSCTADPLVEADRPACLLEGRGRLPPGSPGTPCIRLAHHNERALGPSRGDKSRDWSGRYVVETKKITAIMNEVVGDPRANRPSTAVAIGRFGISYFDSKGSCFSKNRRSTASDREASGAIRNEACGPSFSEPSGWPRLLATGVAKRQEILTKRLGYREMRQGRRSRSVTDRRVSLHLLWLRHPGCKQPRPPKHQNIKKSKNFDDWCLEN